jgi:hypothetical protein
MFLNAHYKEIWPGSAMGDDPEAASQLSLIGLADS